MSAVLSGLLCSAATPYLCAEIAYNAVAGYLGHTPTDVELVAITYWGELAAYREHAAFDTAAIEALWRSFYDPQSGACRREDCSYRNRISWLATMQHWRDSVYEDRVNLDRLAGGGLYLGYDEMLADRLMHNPQWRTGQGPSVPSVWGTAAQSACPQSKEIIACIVIEDAPCDLIAVVVTTEGRMSNLGLCD